MVIDNNDNKSKVECFIKFSPLLDITKYISGKYNKSNKNIQLLPKLNNNNNCYSKIIDKNNSAYIDGFFSFLTSKLLNKFKFIHGTNFYGSFLGIKNELIANIDEDMSYIYNSEFFHTNNDELFKLINFDEDNFFDNDTRKYRNKLKINKNNISLTIDNLDKDIKNKYKYDDIFDTTNDISNLTENNLKIHTLNLESNVDSIKLNIYDISENIMNSKKNSNSTCSSRVSNTNSDTSYLSEYSSSSSFNSEDDNPWGLAVPLGEVNCVFGNFMSGLSFMMHQNGTLMELEKKWGIQATAYLKAKNKEYSDWLAGK